MNNYLSDASYSGNTEEVKKLVESGDDIDDSKAILSASRGKRWNIVRYLSKKKFLTYKPKNIKIAKNQYLSTIRFLLDRNSSDDSYLIKACEEGDFTTAKVLISVGVDINKPGDEGHTPLMEAAMWNRVNIVKLLLEFGADNREKALEMAKERGHTEVVKLLS